ncbi:HAD family hydrolase [Nocardia miyunensis]|uniref:HAD family hydrolase n=1 Tax=Nocardia miyunensis TaxID=282684 RepID=UPI0008332DB9|nr:HAD-IA family hydrolase [Nocardia miyunensis]
MIDGSAIAQAHRCLLLDFDGPVCAVFSDLTDRAAVAELVAELPAPLPDELRTTRDPFFVLQYAATTYDYSTTARLERCFTEFELAAARKARPTPHADEVIRYTAMNSRIIAIVSNNSVTAIDAYLTQHGLRPFVSGIFGRTATNLTKLKPSPFLLEEAVDQLAVLSSDCVFVGDSITDLQAAHAAHVPVVAFANKPGKADDFTRYQPAAVIRSMAELLPASH